MNGLRKAAITFLLLVGCFYTTDVYAHPGNTDEDGGHTCYTNCEDWGLEYGEYHYHDEPEEEEEEPEDDSDITVIDPFAGLGALLFICGLLYWLFDMLRDWWQNRK